jgi:hypothetical protein
MAGEPDLAESKEQQEPPHGVLFRLSLRLGAVVFFAVLAVAINDGVDPGSALIRASVALLVIAACGRLAERVAVVAKQQSEEPEPRVEALPAPEPAANEP